MILPEQTLIKTGALAKELGISICTLCNWTSEPKSVWRSCQLRRGWYLVPKLRAAGLLAEKPQAHSAAKEGVCDVG